MSIDQVKSALLWCFAINYGILFLWFGAFVFAHDWIYRMHTRWFRLSPEAFDILNYAGVAIYKIGVIVFNVVPLIALVLVT